MLYTDGDCVTQADLQSIDSEVSRVASAEGSEITVGGSTGIIRRSIEECGHILKSKMQSFGGYTTGPGLSFAHAAAVYNTGSSVSSPVIRLNQVVISEPDPTRTEFKRWIMYSALSDFYRAVVMRKTSDKYEKKMDMYAGIAEKAWAILVSAGIPFIVVPLPAPAAIREVNVGSWGNGNLTQSTGGSDTGHSYDVVVTWVGASYAGVSAKNNSESAVSPIATIIVTANNKITVDITSLQPPTGVFPPDIGIADGFCPQMAATGWNVYAGISGSGLLTLQNVTGAIAIATKTLTFPDAPTTTGALSGQGQSSDRNYFVLPMAMMRA